MEEKKTGRLQSLKLPRDLSLGITKPKKQYAPNLNVIRNKDKPKEILKKNDQKRRERNIKDRNKQNNDGRYLQSAGVFSQGSGEVKRLSSGHSEGRVSFRDSNNSTVSSMVMPTINRNSWSVNKKDEEAVLDELSHCDIESDDEKTSFTPLTLALDPVTKQSKEKQIKKEEDMMELPQPFKCEFYNEENPGLSLVKLPDSFAGKGLSDDPNVKKLFDYPLSSMLEGQIGKLVVRRSGKIEVHIGRIKYDLTQEQTFDAKQEIATIDKGPNQENYIALLGNVTNSFIMYPDYETLLKK